MKKLHNRLATSVLGIGLVGAVVAAILYFMALPIFDEVDLAWTFVFGLVSAAVAALSLILREIWTMDDGPGCD